MRYLYIETHIWGRRFDPIKNGSGQPPGYIYIYEDQVVSMTVAEAIFFYFLSWEFNTVPPNAIPPLEIRS